MTQELIYDTGIKHEITKENTTKENTPATIHDDFCFHT